MSERTIHFYRKNPSTGQRVRWRMVLDAKNNVIDEVVASSPSTSSETPEKLNLPKANTEQETNAMSAHLANLASRGIQYKVKPDGGIDILHVPDFEQFIHRFFIESSPCFFEGCEAAREEWSKFREDNGAGEGSDCTDCVLGQLMEQFRPRLEPLIQKHVETLPV